MDRLQYIDTLKGWAILSVVLLHFEIGVFPGWLNAWISFYMITAFYFTSGWLEGIKCREMTVSQLVKKRWQSLGKPYIYFSILILLFDIILLAIGHYDLKFIAREIYKTISLRGIGTLWFLPALFGGEVIFRYLLNKHNIIWVIMTLTLSLIYLHYYYYWSANCRNISEVYQLIDAPFCTIQRILYAWPIIGIAYVISKEFNSKLMEMKTMYILMIGIVITSISVYVCGGFYPFSFGDFSPLIVPVIGPLGLLLLAYPMKKGIIVKFLSFWGVNSLVMMVTHYSILLVICQMLDQAIFNEPFSGIRTLAWFIITLISEYPIVWSFNHKAKWMLGKG